MISSKKLIKIFYIVLIISIFISIIPYKAEATLSNVEIEQINKFSEEVSIEDGVGQLIMAGVPGDILNYQNNEYIKKVIIDYGIGNVFMNSYNYYLGNLENRSDEEYLTMVNSFHNYLQSISRQSKLKIPLLVAADFEGANYTSVVLSYRSSRSAKKK